MVVLKRLFKKVTSSSLTEVLVATTIIVVVFGIAIVTLSNVIQSTVASSKTQKIESELNELQYLYNHKKIKIPYTNEVNDWSITIKNSVEKESEILFVEAANKKTQKKIVRKIFRIDEDY